MGRDSSTSLAPGFRFHPTDEELVRYYLKRKVSGKAFQVDPIGVIDIYKSEPWDLPCRSKLKTRDLEWYFFSVLDKKYRNSSRTNRATEKGYWKTTGKDRPVLHNSRIVGMKKTLVYHGGRAPRGTRTNWVMHEYRLADEELERAGLAQDAFVLCRIFQKSGTGPKNGEQYGAPFVEEEWEDEDVAPMPADQAVTDVVVVDGDGAFVETNDLEQNLDTAVAHASAGLPLNFCYGESSSHPEHYHEFVDDQKPLIDTVRTFEPQHDQFWTMPEQYVMNNRPLQDEYSGEASYNENLENFNYAPDNLYLDATDNPLVGNGSFLEANDLMNPVEEAVPAGTDDEHLAYFDADDDVSQYISFDSPYNMGIENPVPDEGLPLTQQNVDEESKDASMATKHDFNEHYGNEASSSKQKPEASMLASGNTYSFVKQASHLLGNIPAPPAFASEFPPEEVALRLHSAAQSSNSAHVTAGMIRITNMTLRSNGGVEWTLSKNGEFNVLISSGYAQPYVNSSALGPVSGLLSGKAAVLVSHGWVFLMFFSVLILSLSFKIGSSMYTGK